MKKQLLGFVIALAVLIIAISAWVIVKSLRTNNEKSSGIIYEPEEKTTSQVFENKNFSERLAVGKKFLENKEFKNAKAELAAAATLEPSEIEPLILLAEAQIHLKEFVKANSNLHTAEQFDAVNPDIFILRGIISIRKENFAEAEKEFAKAGDAGKFWQGTIAAFYDRDSEAKSLLKESTDERATEILVAYEEYESFPDSPKTHLDTLLSRAFVKIEEYELALAKIGPILEDDADYRDAWLLIGYVQFAQQKFELAKQSWQTAFALDSAKPETQYFLGLVNFELNDFAEAEKFLLLARENRMQVANLEDTLAEVYFKQGKYRAAADLLAKQLIENPEATLEDFVQPISIYLEKVKDGRNAWNIANLSLQRFPEEAFSHNLAGWVSLANGYLPEAKNQISEAIRLDPKLPWPYFNLGRYFEKTNNRASALAAYREAFDIDSTSPAGILAAQNYNRLLEENNSTENE